MICGVYKILSRSKPDRVYVGSSIHIHTRWSEHKRALRRGSHGSGKLQRHCDKYGIDDLVFEIIVECTAESRLSVEQEYLDALTPYFNIFPTAKGSFGYKHSDATKVKIGNGRRGKTQSIEARKKMSVSQRRRGFHHSEEHKRLLSVKMTGNKFALGNKLSEPTKRKIVYAIRLRGSQKPNKPLKVAIFGDCGNLASMEKYKTLVSGWTTNPTILRKAGVTDYMAHAKAASDIAAPNRISLEVFADDFDGMKRQAHILAAINPNVDIKIPVTNTQGVFTGPVISALSMDGIRVNVTALFTEEQVLQASAAMNGADGYLSIFAGRIADTGVNPVALICNVRNQCPQKIIWASAREVWNVIEANASQCDIITLPPDLLDKLSLLGKSLEEFSLDTVLMFFRDAQKAGYAIAHPASFGGGGFG